MVDLKEMIRSIIDMWYKCRPEPILIIDESELEGEMKIHHALPEYIHRRLEPELKVDLPNVPEKLTQQQAIAVRALRERDEALAEVERLTQENIRISLASKEDPLQFVLYSMRKSSFM
ncbi:hypothetical protein NL676_034908 [Syzygium grande]|nr:hypothetical protein NL676_034908 [Syzygium grande]